MKNFFTILLLVCFGTLVQAQSKYIKGKLTHLDAPLANAEVIIKGSNAKVKTGVDGSYTISAEIGNVISYSYPSLESIEIIIEDVTEILNVSLNQKITELNEVVVKGSNRKSQKELEEEYSYNPNLVKTAWGFLDKETAPGTMRLISSEDINNVTLCIIDLLRYQFPGVNISGNCTTGGSVNIRGMSSISSAPPAIFDVDGQIITDTPIWILPSQMERVAVLSSLSLTTKYGSIGAGGVVVINTKTGISAIVGTKILDRARLRNNIYQNDAIEKQIALKGLPTFLISLRASVDLDNAKEIYLQNKKKYRSSPHYFIDSYAYFTDKGDSKFADQIIENQKYLFEDHPVYAKALAYHLEANGDLEKAKDLYEQIFIMRPSYSQSYRDLAESYREVSNYKKSAIIYARHNYLLQEGFLESDSMGIFPIMERESENLLALKGDKVKAGARMTNRLAKYSEFEGTRLFFEWNDSEAEFELQFVNPEKHYYTWKHTMEANSTRITNEKLKGYSCEEFLVDESLLGRWQVNLKYKGNKKLEPTYLKVTTYYNYGKTSQRKQVNVYRLGLKNVNQQLFDLNNNGIASAN